MLFLAAAAQLYSADMPVKQVILYKHGIGFFEREGVVPAGDEMRLDFQNNDMNDVLKSLTVTDLAGGRITGIRYDSNETPEQVRNVDSKAKTLIVEQPQAGYSVLSPKPIERTSNAYRFEINLPANGSEKLQVEQEQVTFESSVVSSVSPDYLLTVLQNKQISEAGRKQLSSVADLKRQIAATDESITRTKTELDDLSNDQARLRQNLDSLNRVKGQEEQVRKYSAQLGESDAQIAKLRDGHRDLTTQKASLESQLHDAIEKLDF